MFADAARHGQSLTINGLHLTEEGDKLLARAILQAFPQGRLVAAAEVKGLDDERLRAAVNEKNAQWEARYRTIDGNNVYGGRSSLAYAPKQSYDFRSQRPRALHFQLQSHAGGNGATRCFDRQPRQAHLGLVAWARPAGG